jgi:hypothetical protein
MKINLQISTCRDMRSTCYRTDTCGQKKGASSHHLRSCLVIDISVKQAFLRAISLYGLIQITYFRNCWICLREFDLFTCLQDYSYQINFFLSFFLFFLHKVKSCLTGLLGTYGSHGTSNGYIYCPIHSTYCISLNSGW